LRPAGIIAGTHRPKPENRFRHTILILIAAVVRALSCCAGLADAAVNYFIKIKAVIADALAAERATVKISAGFVIGCFIGDLVFVRPQQTQGFFVFHNAVRAGTAHSGKILDGAFPFFSAFVAEKAERKMTAVRVVG